MMARTEVITPTAMMGIAKVTGSSKFGSTPRRGGIDGICVGWVPGDSNDTDTIVGGVKPGGSDGLYVIVVATMMPESGLGTDGVIVCGVVKGGMASGIRSGCISEAILKLIF